MDNCLDHWHPLPMCLPSEMRTVIMSFAFDPFKDPWQSEHNNPKKQNEPKCLFQKVKSVSDREQDANVNFVFLG